MLAERLKAWAYENNVYTWLPIFMDSQTTNMLSLEEQSRDEVTSSPLIPFMNDRTVEIQKYIQRSQLTLTVDDRNQDPLDTEHGIPAS